jgi:thiol-disulfide isomerase/thioredoxin
VNKSIGIVAAVIALAAAAGGFWLHQRLAGADAADGQPVPTQVHLNDLDGKPHGFDEWRGKLLLINFWATWCGPCLEEIPELVKAQQRYGARGLQVVGPAVDDADAVREMQHSLAMNYPVLIGTPDQLLGLMHMLGNGAGGLPFSVLVDPQGRIVARQLGQLEPAELAGLIEKHLPATPK